MSSAAPSPNPLHGLESFWCVLTATRCLLIVTDGVPIPLVTEIIWIWMLWVLATVGRHCCGSLLRTRGSLEFSDYGRLIRRITTVRCRVVSRAPFGRRQGMPCDQAGGFPRGSRSQRRRYSCSLFMNASDIRSLAGQRSAYKRGRPAPRERSDQHSIELCNPLQLPNLQLYLLRPASSG